MSLFSGAKNLRYIVISGGGARGVALWACIERFFELYREQAERDFDLHGVCGTSIGALLGLCLVWDIPWQRVTDHIMRGNLWSVDSILEHLDLYCLMNGRGACSNRLLYEKVDECFQEFGIPFDLDFARLRQLTGKSLVCNASCINDGTVFLASVDTTPLMSVRDAICMSMCVPEMFEPVEMHGRYYVDGAFFCNYYQDAFPADESVGFLAVNGQPDVQATGVRWFGTLHHALSIYKETGQVRDNSSHVINVYTPQIGANTFFTNDVTLEYLFRCGRFSAEWHCFGAVVVGMLVASLLKHVRAEGHAIAQ